VSRHTESTVELSWKDNATGEQLSVVQRCEGADCKRFENLKGIPGENVTSAVDTRVEAGRTYRYRVFAVKPTAGGAVGTGVSNVVTVRVGGKGP